MGATTESAGPPRTDAELRTYLRRWMGTAIAAQGQQV